MDTKSFAIIILLLVIGLALAYQWWRLHSLKPEDAQMAVLIANNDIYLFESTDGKGRMLKYNPKNRRVDEPNLEIDGMTFTKPTVRAGGVYYRSK